MRLRVLLTACVAVALTVVSARVARIGLDARNEESLNQQRRAVEVISRDAAGLLVLTQDYALHTSARAVRQWRAVHTELTETLQDYAAVGSLQADEASELLGVAVNLPGLFDGLQSALAAPEGPGTAARRETLTDQLINETRRISDGAFEVSHQVTERRRQAAVVQRWEAIGSHAVITAVTLLLAGLLLQRVLSPIARLQKTARAVQVGDLTARVGYRCDDELGELSQDLDAMAATLQERAAALQASHERLARSEAFQQRASLVAGVGAWELDALQQRLIWSTQARLLHEVPEDYQPTQAEALAFFDPAARPLLERATAAALADGTPWDLELPFTTAGGRSLWVRSTAAAEFEDGRVVCLIGALQDVTTRRAADEALRQAALAAQAASNAKTSFLANMSHEIRTPMNAVIGLAFLLQQTRLDVDQRALLDKVASASGALLDVINDVLDLTKIEAGEMEIEQAPFDLRALVDNLVGVMKVQATERGLALDADVSAALPRQLLGDAARLRQVLTNLMGNALKFTEQGRVQLSVERIERPTLADAAAETVWLRFSVQDTGIGIDADVLPRLFMPFVQADTSTTRRFGGTGLGLSIVKRLVEMMGGAVAVSSSPGVGSRFEVSVPLVAADGDADAAPTARPIEVLLAEGDEAECLALQTLAQRLGWRTEAVSSGEALIDRVRARCQAGPGVDVLLVDRQLPGLHGPQALTALTALTELTALRTDGSDAVAPGVLMVSAQGREAALDAPHARLVDVWLDKPVDACKLFNAVRAVVLKRTGDGERVLLASALDVAGIARLPGVRVLVADDSAINLEVARRILEREGACVSVAADGAQAVALLRAGRDFDAVLMDVQMPVLDGLAATRQIRDELGLARLPVIALTAGALLSERQRAVDAGMDGFISKPFDPQVLVALLHKHVEAARGQPLPLAQRTAPPPLASDDWPQIDGIDTADVQRRLEGDVPLFARLLGQLVQEFGDLAVVGPREGLADGGTALAARLHKLAGCAGLLGAADVRSAASQGELLLRDGQAASSIAAVLNQLAGALQLLMQSSEPWRIGFRQAQELQHQSAGEPSKAFPSEDGMREWERELVQRDVTALSRFQAMGPTLRMAWGEERFKVIEAAMHRLDFGRVLNLLRPSP